MKKSQKYIILSCVILIAVIIAGGIIYKNINKTEKGVCVGQGRIVNGSAPFTSEEVYSAMAALKVLFEDKYKGWRWVFQKNTDTGEWEYLSDGYGV